MNSVSSKYLLCKSNYLWITREIVLIVENILGIWTEKLVRYCIIVLCLSACVFPQFLCYPCTFSSGRCSRVNYAIKNPKFYFIQMPNLLTIHLSKTLVYYLLHNDYSSEQLLVSISWIDTENLTKVLEGIFSAHSHAILLNFINSSTSGGRNFLQNSFKFQNHWVFFFSKYIDRFVE